jgi:hypothetical protein
MKYSQLGTAGTVGLPVARALSDDSLPSLLRPARRPLSGPTGAATIPRLE